MRQLAADVALFERGRVVAFGATALLQGGTRQI
jgi:hypothetical protein